MNDNRYIKVHGHRFRVVTDWSGGGSYMHEYSARIWGHSTRASAHSEQTAIAQLKLDLEEGGKDHADWLWNVVKDVQGRPTERRKGER